MTLIAPTNGGAADAELADRVEPADPRRRPAAGREDDDRRRRTTRRSVTPITNGSASGLRKIVCICAPHTASAAPLRPAAAVRGSRTLRTTLSVPRLTSSGRNSASSTVPGDSDSAPSHSDATRATTSSAASTPNATERVDAVAFPAAAGALLAGARRSPAVRTAAPARRTRARGRARARGGGS